MGTTQEMLFCKTEAHVSSYVVRQEGYVVIVRHVVRVCGWSGTQGEDGKGEEGPDWLEERLDPLEVY